MACRYGQLSVVTAFFLVEVLYGNCSEFVDCSSFVHVLLLDSSYGVLVGKDFSCVLWFDLSCSGCSDLFPGDQVGFCGRRLLVFFRIFFSLGFVPPEKGRKSEANKKGGCNNESNCVREGVKGESCDDCNERNGKSEEREHSVISVRFLVRFHDFPFLVASLMNSVIV
jgi:hypothetical protein